jgi:hypothetical protein
MDGRINFWNERAEQLYGWTKEEAVGKVSHDLLQTEFPRALDEIESELVQQGQWKGKLVHATRTGDRLVIESRWILDLKGHSGRVVEINARCTDRETGEAPTESESGNRKTGARAGESMADAGPVLATVADIVLGGGAFLCLLVSFYAIYYYGWTPKKYFSALFIIVYGVLPAVLGSALFAFLRRSREFKVNAALVCASVGVSVYAVEVTLAKLDSGFRPSVTFWGDSSPGRMDEIVAVAKKFGIDFDVRTKFEVIRDLREKGTGAVPATIPFALLMQEPDGSVKSTIVVDGREVLPLGGISNRVTVLCNEIGSHIVYESDERGFHNPQGIWSTSQMTVAALGDSFVIGACVPSNKNFVSVLRERYPGTLNLGMLGEGPLIMLAALSEYLPFVKPKVVLWFFFEENDIRELMTEGKSSLLRNYLDDFRQGLFHRQADIDRELSAHIEAAITTELAKPKENANDRSKHAKHSWQDPNDSPSYTKTIKTVFKLGHLRQTVEHFYRTNMQPREEEYSGPQLKLFRSVLLKAKKSVDAWNGTLYFVYLPARDRYASKANYHRQTILAMVRTTGIPIIDVHARFRLQRDPLKFFPFERFGHYNEEGNRLVAEEVLRSISQERE